jgi:hypothetical protein
VLSNLHYSTNCDQSIKQDQRACFFSSQGVQGTAFTSFCAVMTASFSYKPADKQVPRAQYAGAHCASLALAVGCDMRIDKHHHSVQLCGANGYNVSMQRHCVRYRTATRNLPVFCRSAHARRMTDSMTCSSLHCTTVSCSKAYHQANQSMQAVPERSLSIVAVLAY